MAFESSGTEIVGEFDDKWRPLIELKLIINKSFHKLRCQIDTGCDVALLFRSLEEAQALGLIFDLRPQSASRHEIELADGRQFYGVEANATLFWFGERTVRALAPRPGHEIVWQAERGMPPMLLGIELLRDTVLSLKFVESSREVRVSLATTGL